MGKFVWSRFISLSILLVQLVHPLKKKKKKNGTMDLFCSFQCQKVKEE